MSLSDAFANPPREAFTCRICHAAGEYPVFIVPEFQYGTREPFKYFECSNCGCLQIAEVPEDLGRYYPTQYYSYRAVEGGSAYARFKLALENMRSRYAFYGKGLLGPLLQISIPDSVLVKLRRLKPTPETRILEVGSGSARSLHYLAGQGYRNLTGADPFVPETKRHANGLTVLKKDLLELEGQWDIIMFNHSLEHIPDNLGSLKHARGLLADGGWLAVEIPIAAWAWKHYGPYWYQLDAPRHIFLHTVKSFTILAEEAGFTVREARFASWTSQFWGSESYRRGVKPRPERNAFEQVRHRLYRMASFFPQYLRAKSLDKRDQGDIAAFYLQKK